MNKTLAIYLQELTRKVYLQGAIDSANGYIVDNPEDIDKIIQEVAERTLCGEVQ